MEDIRQYIINRYAEHWKEIGRELGLLTKVLNIIENDNVEPEYCCSAMLKKWFKSQESVIPPPTLVELSRKLVNAIANACSDRHRSYVLRRLYLRIDNNNRCMIYPIPLLCSFTSEVNTNQWNRTVTQLISIASWLLRGLVKVVIVGIVVIVGVVFVVAGEAVITVNPRLSRTVWFRWIRFDINLRLIGIIILYKLFCYFT